MVYVMSDIHGQYDLYKKMLKEIGFTDEDELYVLGDVIDRGHDGIRILLSIMNRKNVHMLIGNHEQMMLNCLTKNRGYDWELWHQNCSKTTEYQFSQYSRSTQNKIVKYIKKMPYYYDINVDGKDYILVHAAPHPDLYSEYPFSFVDAYDSENDFAVWSSTWPKDKNFRGKTIVFGHVFTARITGCKPMIIYKTNQESDYKSIGIDCGCATIPFDNCHCSMFGGRLACLRLNDMKEYYVERVNNECTISK